MDDGGFEGVLDAARAGDREALGTVWRRWNPPLVRYLAGRGAISAEDLAADVWIEAARGLPRFAGGPDDFARWLFTIAGRRLIDDRRRATRAPDRAPAGAETATADGRTPEAIVVEHDSVARAVAFVRELAPDQAEAVLLRVVAGLDVADVAEMMGRSPGAVRVLTHRGLRRLADLVAGVTEDEYPSIEGVR